MDEPHQGEQGKATSGVVLVYHGAAVHPTLADAMTRRGWATTSLDDPCLAMAELCLLERAQAARTAWGLNGGRHLVLVLADGVPNDALVDAVQWYLPDVAIWRADGEALTPVDSDGRTGTTAGTPLAATSNAEPESIPEVDDQEPPPLPPPTEITADEIDMLFGTSSPETRR